MKHNWEYKRLGDVAPAKPFKGTITSADGRYWCLNLDKVESNTGVVLEYDFIEETELGGSVHKFTIDNVLFSKLRPNLNKVVVPEQNGYCTTELVPLYPLDILNRYYLAYYLRSPKYVNFLIGKTGGAKMPRVKMDIFWNSTIPVPPMETQEQIVAELDQINDLIAKNRELLSQLDALAQSLFYDTFGDPIANPKGWRVSKIGVVTSVQTGATPSREIDANFMGKIPWVKTTEVQNCNIFNTEEHISEDALANSNCKIFPIDTILVAMYGQGKTRGQIARLKIEACTNQACAAILPSNRLHPSFVFSFLLASYEPLRSVAVGCNQKNLNLSLIKNYPIILPSLSLQEDFAAKVEAIEAQKAKVEAEIAELQTLLDARMDYWFND